MSSRNNKEEGKWCRKMKLLSLEENQHHLPPSNTMAEKGREKGNRSEITTWQKSMQEWTLRPAPPQRPAYRHSVDRGGFSSSSGSGSSGSSGGTTNAQCPGASYTVGGPMKACEMRREEAWQSEEMQKKYPTMLTLVPAECDSNSDEWIPIVKERLLDSFSQSVDIDKLREIFTNGEEARDKVGYEEWDEIKEAMGILDLDNETFLRLLSAIISLKELREQMNLSPYWAYSIYFICSSFIAGGEEYISSSMDLTNFWNYYNNKNSDRDK